MPDLDLIVIGSGPGGYVAAIRAAQLGAKVALVEEKELGGTCLNWGCIPTKAIIESIKVYRSAKKAGTFGISMEGLSINYPQVIQRKNQVVEKLRKGVEYLLKENKIELVKGRGEVKGPGKVEVSGKTLEAKNIILATGSKPAVLKGMEPDGKHILNTDQMLNLDEIPETMLIVGGGVIGCEFASIFAELGTKVTIAEMLPRILPLEDEEVSALLERSFKKRGIDIKTGTKIASEELKNYQKVLIATGRVPNVGNGFQTVPLPPNVHAIGDLAPGPMLAHKASAEGMAIAEKLFGSYKPINYAAIPNAIFTYPEIASVGLSEKEAREKGLKIKIGKFPYSPLGRSLAAGTIEGFFKIIAEEESEKILGVHIIGEDATDLIGQAALAIELGAKVSDLERTVHAHPTFSEGIKEAAENFFKRAIHIRNV